MHRYMLSHCACMGDAGSILACIISCSQMQINANKYKYMQLTLCQIKYNKLYNNILLTIMEKKSLHSYEYQIYVSMGQICKTMGTIFR